MYINKIMVDDAHIITFASSVEVFHLLEPIYHEIRTVLMKWGYTRYYDHSFRHGSGKTVKFFSQEEEFWEPDPHTMTQQYPQKQQELMLILTIIKLFKDEVNTSEVEPLLEKYKIV